MARLLITLAGCALLAGCDREAPAPPPEPSAAPAASQRLEETTFALANEAAFDVIALPDGALVAFAESRRVEVLRLDRAGTPRGKPERVAELEPGASAPELAARSNERGVGIAWIEQRGSSGVLRAVLGDAKGSSFAPAKPLAPASAAGHGRRGNLALAGDASRMIAFHRVNVEPCQGEPKRQCTRIGFSELAGSSPQPNRIPLSVPAACSSPIAGFVVSDQRWDYAVCSTAGGREQITVFRIQYDPRYAEAHPVLSGCTPAGATALGRDVLVAGDCADGRRVARVTDMGETPEPLDLSEISIECELGHPVVRAAGAPRLSLRLDTPRDGLATLLPPLIAPAGARGVDGSPAGGGAPRRRQAGDLALGLPRAHLRAHHGRLKKPCAPRPISCLLGRGAHVPEPRFLRAAGRQ